MRSPMSAPSAERATRRRVMSKSRHPHNKGFSRRGLLKSLGVGAGLAPFVPLLHVSGQEAKIPKRLLLVYTPDGTPDSDAPGGGPIDWMPTGTTTNFTLNAIHAPLAPFQSKLVVPWGLVMSAEGAGEQHAYGMAGLWTGASLHD